jgi:hypothetical protein
MCAVVAAAVPPHLDSIYSVPSTPPGIYQLLLPTTLLCFHSPTLDRCKLSSSSDLPSPVAFPVRNHQMPLGRPFLLTLLGAQEDLRRLEETLCHEDAMQLLRLV